MGRILSNITPLSFCMQKFGYTLKSIGPGEAETQNDLNGSSGKTRRKSMKSRYYSFSFIEVLPFLECD